MYAIESMTDNYAFPYPQLDRNDTSLETLTVVEHAALKHVLNHEIKSFAEITSDRSVIRDRVNRITWMVETKERAHA